MVRSPFPASRIFPQPVGILFPGPNAAAGVNPAALPAGDRFTALQAAISPATRSGDPSEYFGSVAVSSKNFGLGIGYDGFNQGGTLTNGMFAGAGYQIEGMSFGLGLRDADLGSNSGADVDLGLRVGQGKGVTFGGVLYGVNRAESQLDVGLGDIEKNFNVEINALLPPFSSGDTGYAFTASAMVLVNPFWLYLRSTYFTGPEDFSHTVGLALNVSPAVNVAFEFSTPSLLTTAVTVFL